MIGLQQCLCKAHFCLFFALSPTENIRIIPDPIFSWSWNNLLKNCHQQILINFWLSIKVLFLIFWKPLSEAKWLYKLSFQKKSMSTWSFACSLQSSWTNQCSPNESPLRPPEVLMSILEGTCYISVDFPLFFPFPTCLQIYLCLSWLFFLFPLWVMPEITFGSAGFPKTMDYCILSAWECPYSSVARHRMSSQLNFWGCFLNIIVKLHDHTALIVRCLDITQKGQSVLIQAD